MKRTRFLLATALVGALLLVLLLQPKPPAWTLPDGSTLQLAKVSWGLNHAYHYGHRPVDLLYPFIPRNWRSNFNFQVATISNPPPGALVVWFKRTGIPTNTATATPTTRRVTNIPAGPPGATAMLLRASEPYMVSVVDEFGVESRTSSDVRVGPIDNSTLLAGVVFSSYPRRAKSFGVRIHWSSPLRTASSGGSTTLLGELRVANPAGGRSGSAWTPEPLPATHQTNGLELTLLSLETGVTVADALAGPGRQRTSRVASDLAVVIRRLGRGSDFHRRTHSRAAFVVRENGVTVTNWGICRWVLSDDAGERHPLSISPGTLFNPTEVIFADSLWLDEPAWKLEVELARTASFPPEELWSVKGLAVPVEGQSAQPELATNLHGVEIKCTGMTRTRWMRGAAPAAASIQTRPGVTPPPAFAVDVPSLDQLAFNLQAPDLIRLTLLEARDDRGRGVPLENSVQRTVSSRSANIPGKLTWLFQFNFPTNSKMVELTIAVSPRRNFEFHVKPTLASAGAKPAQ